MTSGNIQIINLKRNPSLRDTLYLLPPDGDIVYIGRENKWLNLPRSKWANPFVLEREADRDAVLERYRQYVLSQPDLMAALPELHGKTLACYCAPKRCHGEVLIELYSTYVNV
jgi:hypothetical protein